MRYSRRTLNYLKRIILSDRTYMMSIIDHVAISIETLRKDSECFLEKEVTKLIRMNHIYIIVNQINSCHGCVCGPLT